MPISAMFAFAMLTGLNFLMQLGLVPTPLRLGIRPNPLEPGLRNLYHQLHTR